MSPTFILAPTPAASALPSSPSLNLLPFSLGPTSKPYTTPSAPLSTFFRPRPAPSGTPGIPTGTPIAAFRGREIAGQSVPVPRGYRGIVIAADRPDVVKYSSASAQGPNEAEGEIRGRAQNGKWPLTPAASSASVGGGSSSATTTVVGEGECEDGTEMRRSTRSSGFERLKQRVKGAGQVALARPKRGAVKTGKKRYRLDSDDEDEAGGAELDSQVDIESPSSQITPTLDGDVPVLPTLTYGTPSKRPRSSLISTPTRQSPRLALPRTPIPPSSRKAHLPAITLQEATPLKEPLPPPPAHLRRKKNKADYVIPGTPGAEVLVEQDETDPAVASPGGSGVDELKEVLVEEGMIPSPATENDPPTFPVLSAAPSPETPKIEKEPFQPTRAMEQDLSSSLDISGPIRVLRPVSSFDAITLWTPDGPLAGYKPPNASGQVDAAKAESAVSGTAEALASAEASAAAEVKEEDGPKVREGWWAPGGSGEGGDEVVRAMGEWLGLVEMLNEPVYLDKYQDEDGDEDDDE